VAALLDVAYQTVNRWWQSYLTGGMAALSPGRRGRTKGQHRTLTSAQETEIQTIICDRHPEQYKLKFALWTRQAIMELIEQKFSIRLPIRTAGEYLKRWGYASKSNPQSV
jgi:transposase